MIGWIVRSRGEAVAEPILIALGVKDFKRYTPKEIQISPKVKKIINAKKTKKDYD